MIKRFTDIISPYTPTYEELRVLWEGHGRAADRKPAALAIRDQHAADVGETYKQAAKAFGKRHNREIA